MIRSSFPFAILAIVLGGCSSHETPASDAQVAAAEARAERSDVVEECLSKVDDRYQDAISGCDDAACKAAVEQEKVSWYQACQ